MFFYRVVCVCQRLIMSGSHHRQVNPAGIPLCGIWNNVLLHSYPVHDPHTKAHLIFVTSISSSASVIFLTEGNFSQCNQKERQYFVFILHTLCNFTHSVQLCTHCVTLHTLCNFTHSVLLYLQRSSLHTVCNFSHIV